MNDPILSKETNIETPTANTPVNIFIEPKINTELTPKEAVDQLSKLTKREYGAQLEKTTPGSFTVLRRPKTGEVKRDSDNRLVEYARTKNIAMTDVYSDLQKEHSKLASDFEKTNEELTKSPQDAPLEEFEALVKKLKEIQEAVLDVNNRIDNLKNVEQGKTEEVNASTLAETLASHATKKTVAELNMTSRQKVGGEIKKPTVQQETPVIQKTPEETKVPEAVVTPTPNTTPSVEQTKTVTENIPKKEAQGEERLLREGQNISLVNNKTGKYEQWNINRIYEKEGAFFGDVKNITTGETKTFSMIGLEKFAKDKEREDTRPKILRPQIQENLEKKKSVQNLPLMDLISMFKESRTNEKLKLLEFYVWEEKWLKSRKIDEFRKNNGNIPITEKQIATTKRIIDTYKKILEKSDSGDSISRAPVGNFENDVTLCVRILSGVQDENKNDIKYYVDNYKEEDDLNTIKKLESYLTTPEKQTEAKPSEPLVVSRYDNQATPLSEWRKQEEERVRAMNAATRLKGNVIRDPGNSGSFARLVSRNTGKEIPSPVKSIDTVKQVYKPYLDTETTIKPDIDEEKEKEILENPSPKVSLLESQNTGGMTSPLNISSEPAALSTDEIIAREAEERALAESKEKEETRKKKMFSVGNLMQTLSKSWGNNWKRYATAIATVGVVSYSSQSNSLNNEGSPAPLQPVTEAISTPQRKSWLDYQTIDDRNSIKKIAEKTPEEIIGDFLPNQVDKTNPYTTSYVLDMDAYKIINSPSSIYGLNIEQRKEISDLISNFSKINSLAVNPANQITPEYLPAQGTMNLGVVKEGMTIRQLIELTKSKVAEANQKDNL